MNSPRATFHQRRVALAHDRRYEQILDRETGRHMDLAAFLGGDDYGRIVDDKRVALENDLVEGRVRYVCPWCESPMVLRSIPTRDRSEERFYFKHKDSASECAGAFALSADEITARKFAHAKEGAEHKRFKQLVADSIAADPDFTETRVESRWVDADGTRWRQPDVQSQWKGQRIAFEVQLSTTFLHVLAERMTFYRRNDGLLLWLFRDLDADEFRLTEDDLFFSNNRNAFRVTEATRQLSEERGCFVLECIWHEPTWVNGVLTTITQQGAVNFGDLTFDVSASGTPRAYRFDYDGALQRLVQQQADEARYEAEERDQGLREAMEAAMVGFDLATDGGPAWQSVRRQFRERGFELPMHLSSEGSPLYLLQAAYSAKLGRPVACRLPNLIALANNLFQRHKSTLWVFSVLMRHYQREAIFRANGDIARWRKRRDEYRRGWREDVAEFAPDRQFDRLLAFLFPDTARALARSPAEVERARGCVGEPGSPARLVDDVASARREGPQ